MIELRGRPREELDELAGWRGVAKEHTGTTALTWGGTGGEAVHHAVPDQRGRGEDADAWVVDRGHGHGPSIGGDRRTLAGRSRGRG